LAGTTALWAALTYFFYRNRIWLLYYVVGAVGLALLLIWSGRTVFPLELWLKQSAAYAVHFIAQWFGIETRIFESAPGTILVLVIPQSQGWTLVEIGVECSGLLEEAVLIGLASFYPGWGLPRRLGWLSLGIAATYLGNLLRILFIVMTLHFLGKDTLFLAHTLVGRVFFFFIVIAIYWAVFTQPTLRQLRATLQARLAG
jgi:exosortase family protein XrtG